MSKVSYITQDAFDRMKAELDHLKTKGRKEASQAIAEAREKGDLSENAEYDAAKDAQGLLELKINKMEIVLANSKIISEKDIDTSKVGVLNLVKIKHLKLNREFSYKLVAESESDTKAGKISVESPIGKGLLGKKVGEKAKIVTPSGEVEFEVLDISI